MNERIKLIRKYYKLSQTAFGEQIGVTLGVIRNLETGKTTLTSPLFELFCSIYNVNPEWLKTGNGEMFVPPSESPFDEFANSLNLSDKAIKIIQGFSKLSKSEQDIFIDLAEKIFADEC